MEMFMFPSSLCKLCRVSLNSARSCENLTIQISTNVKNSSRFYLQNANFQHFPIEINVNNRAHWTFVIVKNRTTFQTQM